MSQYTKGQTVTISVDAESVYQDVHEGTYVEAMYDGDGHIVTINDPLTGALEAMWFFDEEVSA